MSLLLGNVTVPSPTIGTVLFPVTVDFPVGVRNAIKVVVHQFGSLDGKIEQCFALGAGGLEYDIRRAQLNPVLEASLKTFWLANRGPVSLFPFNAPNQNGSVTLNLCRFKTDVLTIDAVRGAIKSFGLTICQLPNYTNSGGPTGTWTYTPPTYPVNSIVTRFPTTGLAAALLQQNQTLFPLVKIIPLATGYPAIYLSDRDVILNGSGYSNQLFQARILKWSGIEQYMIGGPSSSSGGADQAQFVLGNADRTLSALKNDVDLKLARIEFSIFHQDTGTKIDFWAGQVDQWECGVGDPAFTISATDGFSELSANYPPRTVVRTCWKAFAGGAGQPCTWTSGTGLNGAYPGALSTECDKGYFTSNGCDAHNNATQWGGIDAQPQGVTVLVNNTGFIGFGRQSLTTFSVISDTAFNSPLPEIWCDMDELASTNTNYGTLLSDQSQGMPITPIMMAYRDEADFADGLAIVGAGPIGAMALANTGYASFFMDAIPFQGWAGPGGRFQPNYGLRNVLGSDPSSATDFFALGSSSNGAPSTYSSPQHVAGTAYTELRIAKSSTFVPSGPDSHNMLLTLRKGLSGYTWSAPGARSGLTTLSNPIWIAVNAALRTKGYFFASAATQETIFSVNETVSAAAICDALVTPLIGSGTERQFMFHGVCAQVNGLRDWISDILSCCLGYFWIQFGKLTFGIRENASVVEPFNTANILWNTLRVRNAMIGFNRLNGSFGDVEFNFQKNAVQYWDEDFAKYWGGNPLLPKIISKEMNFPGVCTKSQCGRIIATRSREETGGIGTKCTVYHSEGEYSTTILALNVAPGMVCSMGDSDTMLDVPNYPAAANYPTTGHAAQSNFMKYVVNRLKLNPDYSIDISYRTVHDDMYDLVNGPKPVDIIAVSPPVTTTAQPDNIIYDLATDGDGNVILSGLQIGTYAATVNRITFEIYSIDGTQSGATCEIHGAVAPGDLTITFAGVPPSIGYALIDQEIVYIQSVSGFVATVLRAQLGTTAASHSAVNTTISTVNSLWPLDLIVGSGLAIAPGMRASNSTPKGNSFVSEYVASSGLVRISAPLGAAPLPTGTFHAYPLIVPLQLTSQMISVPGGFFVSGDVTNWNVAVNLPCAGIACARVKATSSAGVDSAWFPTNFIPLLRTFGGNTMILSYPQIPMGTTLNAFEPLSAPQTQDFIGAFAQISNLTGIMNLPVLAPVPATDLTLSGISPTGSITVGGSADATSQIQVSVIRQTVGGKLLGRSVFASGWASDATLTTLGGMAAALSAWLNADPVFSRYYVASAAGSVISITDLLGMGGAVHCASRSGGLTTYTSAGFSSVLGVLSGRSYAFAYEDAVDGYLSDLSQLSFDTGPTGPYAQINVNNIPISPDSRVGFIHVYGFPDGTNSGPCYRLGRIANASADGSGFAGFADAQVESGLSGLTAYPGPAQPSQANDLILKVNRDGVEWFELHVPPNAGASNIETTQALRGLSQGAAITVDVVNNIAPLDLKFVLR